ncbi:MAG: glycosyltransferase [Candidatus Omnitrophota bacterium]
MKILIVYASAGAGHKSAAYALNRAFKLLNKDQLKIEVVDILDYTNRFFKRLYSSVYLFLVNYLPTLWGLFYWLLDCKFVCAFFRPLRRMINQINSGKFVRLLINKNYDMVVSVHFMSSEVVSELKKRNKISSKLITIVTDYGTHSFWLSENTDIFIVAYEKTKEELISRGIAAEKIKILGIPIDPIFSVSFSSYPIRKRLGLKQNLFTILVVGGCFGVGPIIKIVKSLMRLHIPHQLIILSGKNYKMLKQLKKIKQNVSVPIRILGYIDNMYDLMAASDLIITKSGGLTISESLAKKLPMIIVSPIPGQETKNANLLAKYKVAIKTNRIKDIPAIIESLFNNALSLNEIKAKINDVARPDSARDVAEFIYKMLNENV